ncbi:TetR/AcrR family transcriptional regulator [Rhizobium sp. M1]|uniref:TetR/AcrR family transcriptional regulator n=1 Tax=Rhizobium sp. M1 TaxID=2035453 RepID=UPI000BE9505F|nr:TetR/AcrR family transcriptional regulator [Rhizobium sp. M1]PDT10227.1 transcriptional regulator [Rhizobium sp. M1]
METAKQKVDRRVARTRAALHRALISLILKKGYDPVTVEEICEAANVGRSTFYLHYASKDDLKQHGLDGLRRQLADTAARAGQGETFGFSLAMFEHARDHIDLYRALADSRGGAVALGTIREILSDLVRDDLTADPANRSSDTILREFAVQYVVGAYMAVLTWWLDGGAKLPPHQMDAMFRRMVSGGAMTTHP